MEKTNRKNIQLVIAHLIIFSLLMVSYIIIQPLYSYVQFSSFHLNFNLLKMAGVAGLLAILLFLFRKINDPFTKLIYGMSLVMLLYGECVCYIFNEDQNIASIISVTVYLFFLVLFQKIKIKQKGTKTIKNSYALLIIASIILFLPFVFLYYNKINLNNLFLSDVYETRMLFRGESNALIGYLSAPLSRVLLPALLLTSIRDKKYGFAVMCIVFILFIFLCGALKSILFGLIAALFMYRGTYEEKNKRVMITLIIILLAGILLQLIFKNNLIINIERRIFFVPPRLNSAYANYFAGNYTYLSHSPLGLLFGTRSDYASLSMYFGEKILGVQGLNANVGLMIEGFISFGYMGLIVFSAIAALIMHYFRSIKIQPLYIGIIIVYIYYMNTAFISTLLVTHGLLFLIIFSYLFMRGTENVQE